MLIRGRHVHFDVDLRTMAVLNWTLTGAENPGRLVDHPTVIFAEKTPLHGAVLTRTERLRNDRGDLVFTRTNGAVSVKIRAKDCAQGGVFQMDSPQAATRVQHPTCTNLIPKRDGSSATVRHCGGLSEWDVLSDGRMGQVMGEDATEVAPPATFCVKDCQAQNQVRGGAVVLGHPFPVPDAFRLKPRTP